MSNTLEWPPRAIFTTGAALSMYCVLTIPARTPSFTAVMRMLTVPGILFQRIPQTSRAAISLRRDDIRARAVQELAGGAFRGKLEADRNPGQEPSGFVANFNSEAAGGTGPGGVHHAFAFHDTQMQNRKVSRKGRQPYSQEARQYSIHIEIVPFR